VKPGKEPHAAHEPRLVGHPCLKG